MSRRKLSDRRARHDAAYRRAKESGFAGRAVYKLQEIDRRFHLLGRGRRVLDLGCWPGSWMQYAAERVGDEGVVVGIDLKPVDLALAPWAHTFVADVEELDPTPLVERFGDFDVVLSDMAPQTTGDRATDVYRSETLARRALDIARIVLRPGGHLAVKVFQGGGFSVLLVDFRAAFQTCKPFHADATRAGSREQYLIARGLKPSARDR
jgi:23S rRNA (uridine2552-2'-O)-methyltransferase